MKLVNVTKNIRAAGMTVSGWARKNSFSPQTVHAVIGGFTGSRRLGVTESIIKALHRDGFLSKS